MTDWGTTIAFACSYTEEGTGGIVCYRLDESTGELRELGRESAAAATYLTLDPDRFRLYTVNRISGGMATAYRIDSEEYTLSRIDRVSCGGSGPSYISLDEDGRFAFVSNYVAGTVAMLPIEEDGQFGDGVNIEAHRGSSSDPDRQREPHPHSIGPGPGNRYVYAPDLGTDRIMTYRFDPPEWRPATPAATRTAAGAGPRHFACYPDGQFCYVINELDSTITGYAHDPDTGSLTEIETVGTLPDGFEGDNLCADIHLHPSGDWLYGSNRGHDSIAIFSVDGDRGRLRPVDHESTRGHWPRHFALDPGGRYLYAENRRSDTIVPFAIDESTGRLTPTGSRISIAEPLCLQFLAPSA